MELNLGKKLKMGQGFFGVSKYLGTFSITYLIRKIVYIMAIPVVDFSRVGYKIRKIFA
jgi:hypothetical protein